MIGITILDNLSEEDLVRVVKGTKRIRIPLLDKSSIPQNLIPEPQLIQFKEMDNDKIITLCKMEIESRLGWIYLKELIDTQEK